MECARRGRRVAEATPEGNWKILTILGAMSLRGLIATMTIEAATHAEIFLAYLDHVLCPVLRSGDVVVMDNLSSHKVTEVRERIERAGAELFTCRLTRPTSTPSKKPGPNSNNDSAPPKQEPQPHLIKQLQSSSRPSALKTQPPGSDCLSMLYSNS